MKRTIVGALLMLVALVLAPCAQAAITCSVSSSGFAAAYSPATGTTNITQTFFTVTCTRGATSDPASVNYGVKADNGLNPQGQNNRAMFGGNRLGYDVYTNASCGTQWKGNTTISGTINFSATGTVSQQRNFWGCIGAGQTGLAAGTYTDTVTLTMTYGSPQSSASGSFGVTITTPPVCTVSTAPGTVDFAYVSFGAAANASTSFGVTCTLALPYTMALDATSGTILGINYTLSLSSSSSTGTGSAQTFQVNGSIAAGQSGTCAGGTCIGTQARTLTITY